MLKYFLPGLAMLLVVTCSCNRKQHKAASGHDKEVIRVMTYNIHHANPPSRQDYIDVKAIAQVIRRQRPDLVALQEVDVHTKRSGSMLNEAEDIAAQTGMQVYFAKAIDHDGGDYGVAILSKFPLSNSQNHKLPTAAGTKGEPRVMATAIISLRGGKKIVFACTHLDAQKADTNRVLQINAIAEILSREQLPVIIGGDFNATSDSRVITVLDKFMTRTCVNDCAFTIPVLHPDKTIDFIASTSSAKLTAVSHRVIPETYASDHLPVIAEIHMP